ncbi:hypothetical protein [Planctomicrobium sp. SH664]|uniref:hypothetical protein n=1 Tax=Planctomicrobium sp. SH664 TaxID=3448125 RepID=UPI003F5BB11C
MSDQRKSWVGIAGLFLSLTLLNGCGDSGPNVPVKGDVTFDGAVLNEGSVCFHDSLGTTVGVGFIKDGHYDMQQSMSMRGLPPGDYQISVMSWIERPGTETASGKISPGVSRIPMKYVDPKTSGFTAHVGPKGEKIDLALTK